MADVQTQRDLDRQLLSEASSPEPSSGRLAELLRLGADPKARDTMGFDALMRVCARGAGCPHAGALAWALIPVSDLGAVDGRGWCAAAIAARAGTAGALAELVAAEVPMPADADGVPPAQHARDEATQVLMEAAELREMTTDARSGAARRPRKRI